MSHRDEPTENYHDHQVEQNTGLQMNANVAPKQTDYQLYNRASFVLFQGVHHIICIKLLQATLLDVIK